MRALLGEGLPAQQALVAEGGGAAQHGDAQAVVSYQVVIVLKLAEQAGRHDLYRADPVLRIEDGEHLHRQRLAGAGLEEQAGTGVEPGTPESFPLVLHRGEGQYD